MNPDSLDPEECPEGCTKKWEMSVFEGEWVRGNYFVYVTFSVNDDIIYLYSRYLKLCSLKIHKYNI